MTRHLSIDSFYRDRNLGTIKFKGYLEGSLIFDQFIQHLGVVANERVTLNPELNRKRISRLQPIPPPL